MTTRPLIWRKIALLLSLVCVFGSKYICAQTQPPAPAKLPPGYMGSESCKDCHAEIYKKIATTCLNCHQYGEEHSNFLRSAHKSSDVNCLDCHSPHHYKESQFLLVKAQPQLCYGCHAEVKPDFAKTFHHRVDEKLIKCTDCHNQHGGFANPQLRAAANQDAGCLKCHIEKA